MNQYFQHDVVTPPPVEYYHLLGTGSFNTPRRNLSQQMLIKTQPTTMTEAEELHRHKPHA